VRKKENIVLDARLHNVIGNAAFKATLANGHEFVAFARDGELLRKLRAGDSVKVELSPCDMSKGCIVNRTENESSKLS